jgi:hypothetical protein
MRKSIPNVNLLTNRQFGNCLTLQAAYRSNGPLKDMISPQELRELLDKTINFLYKLGPICPALMTDARILQHTRNIVFPLEPMSSQDQMSTSFG